MSPACLERAATWSSINSISKPEAVKQQSRQLRGHLARDLADPAVPFDKEGYSLLKFHGIYQGYDRDSATERKQRGDDKLWQFMVRVRIPGGRLTAAQYLALDELADRYANGSLRVTTRQSIQFHGVVKSGLKATMAEINEALLTTLAACGDVVRTVTTAPAPIRDAVHDRLEAETRRLLEPPAADDAAPITRSGSTARSGSEDQGKAEKPDPLYGERYLPRKFKIGLAIPEDNTIDVLTNDLGIVALFEGERLAGYNFLLGGGHGMTHNNPKTYPRLATPVAFVEPEDLLDGGRGGGAAAPRLRRPRQPPPCPAQIRHRRARRGLGARAARRISRQEAGAVPRRCRAFAVPDHLGWHEQGDGKLYLGIPVPSGRIVDDATSRLRTALREIVARFRCDPILMPSQDIILSEIRPRGPRRDRGGPARAWRAPRRGHAAGRSAGRWPARRCRPAAWR